MTWEQKFAALGALGGDISLQMRSPGNWYVTNGFERVEDAFLSGGLIQEPTPEQAVEKYWEWATQDSKYKILFVWGAKKYFQWNGYMWRNVTETMPK